MSPVLAKSGVCNEEKAGRGLLSPNHVTRGRETAANTVVQIDGVVSHQPARPSPFYELYLFHMRCCAQVQSSRDSCDLPANMPSVAEYQQKYDEISEIRQAAKKDFSMSNAKKREIAEQYKAAANDLRAASRAAMASPHQPQPNTNQLSGSAS
ncbi:hypothetical protein NHJ13734_009712 [Beauveria thailandica]